MESSEDLRLSFFNFCNQFVEPYNCVAAAVKSANAVVECSSVEDAATTLSTLYLQWLSLLLSRVTEQRRGLGDDTIELGDLPLELRSIRSLFSDPTFGLHKTTKYVYALSTNVVDMVVSKIDFAELADSLHQIGEMLEFRGIEKAAVAIGNYFSIFEDRYDADLWAPKIITGRMVFFGGSLQTDTLSNRLSQVGINRRLQKLSQAMSVFSASNGSLDSIALFEALSTTLTQLAGQRIDSRYVVAQSTTMPVEIRAWRHKTEYRLPKSFGEELQAFVALYAPGRPLAQTRCRSGSSAARVIAA